MSIDGLTKNSFFYMDGMPNLRILEVTLLTKQDILDILVMSMKMSQYVYGTARHQICKIATYFVEMEPFLSEWARTPDSAYRSLQYLNDWKGSHYYGIFQ